MEDNLWVLEILTGKTPDQTSIYKHRNSYNIKKDIIKNLFGKINKVRFASKYGPGKIIQSLSKRKDIVKQIQNTVNHVYFHVHQPVNIVYSTSPRLQYIIKYSNDSSDILVYVPITSDEDWKN